jgi:hypothetical protein
MQENKLLVEGHATLFGVYIPDFGNFLPPPQNGLHLVTQTPPPIVRMDEDHIPLEDSVHLPGQTQRTIKRCISEGLFSEIMLRDAHLFDDRFKLTAIVQYEGNTASVRRAPNPALYGMFYVYALIDVNDNQESDVLAEGFIASPWKFERDMAVIDGIWPAKFNATKARSALCAAIEEEAKKTMKAIRICSSVDLSQHGSFFANQWYRLMERNRAAYTHPGDYFHRGRIELVKILNPNFDTAMIDHPFC